MRISDVSSGVCSSDLELAHELVHVEVVAPGGDLPVDHLEGTHDGQRDLLARVAEDVAPLGAHRPARGRDGEDLELDRLHARGERLQGGADGGGAHKRVDGDVVVPGVLGQEAEAADAGGRYIPA